MASDLSKKVEKFLSNPCKATWADVPLSDSAAFKTFFREQGSSVVDRQRNPTTLQAALRYLATIIEHLEVIPDADQVALARISELKNLIDNRIEALREEEAAKEAASVIVHEGSGASRFVLPGACVFIVTLAIYCIGRTYKWWPYSN